MNINATVLKNIVKRARQRIDNHNSSLNTKFCLSGSHGMIKLFMQLRG